jgi:23S rRNA (pseudouridine1915-N3)-methyltransferase
LVAACDILLGMVLVLAHIASRATSAAAGKSGLDALTNGYLERCAGFARCETQSYRSEEALLESLDNRQGKKQGRTRPVIVLLDSQGRQLTSEAFAAWLGARRDDVVQQIVFAVGPADGWSDIARRRANLALSFGAMTMAHALARLVIAEQIYRATTILSGHPYHTGH